jgi:hypothetical protein
MPAGQTVWNSRANLNQNEFVIEAMIGTEMSYEIRQRGAFGKIAKYVAGMTVNNSNKVREDGLETHGVIKSQTITSGDEARFSLVRNLDGTVTYGDAPVRDGDYLAFMHANMKLNALRTPAYKLTEEMAKMRASTLLQNEEGEIKKQVELFLAEEYNYECYRGLLCGQSMGLKAALEAGGRAQDIGRGLTSAGVGKNISIPNVVVLGVGELSGPTASTSAALDTFEAAIGTNIQTQQGLGAGLGGISMGLIQDLRRWVVSKKIRGFDMGGQEKWFVPCDPGIIAQLTKLDQSVANSWSALQANLYQGSKDQNAPHISHGFLDIEGFIFYPDYTLEQFRPSITAGNPAEVAGDTQAVRWGCAELGNPRNYTRAAADTTALMMILGPDVLLEANNGSVKSTRDEGRHEQGQSIAFHLKQACMRTRWLPKDGTTVPELNQQSALVLARVPNLSFT